MKTATMKQGFGKRVPPVAWLALVVLALMPAGPASALDHVNETVGSSTTWTLADSPHVVSGYVTVDNNATLTIEAGVEVRFNTNAYLRVGNANYGTLIAEGTDEVNVVMFMANVDEVPWRYIYFSSKSVGSVLDYVTIEDGGADGSMVRVSGSSPTIEHTTIRNSAGDGMVLESGALPALYDLFYGENDGYPLNVDHAHSVSAVDDTSEFHPTNTDNRVRYAGGAITTDTGMADAGVPYYVAGNVTIDNTATLTIDAGAELQFASNLYLRVGNVNAGRLTAVGAVGNEILLTADDPLTPWRYLYFASDAYDDSVVDHAVIEDGGSDGSLVRCYDASPTITNTTIRGSAGDGLLLQSAALPTLENNTYEGNDGFPINVDHVHSLSSVDDTSTFDGSNTDNRVRYEGGMITTDMGMADAGVPYFVAGSITVDNNATMTVDAGAELQFASNLYLRVGNVNAGRLTAVGTAGNEILFTADDPLTPWRYLFFAAKADDESLLDHAVVEDGGSDGSLVRCYDASPTITNTTIQNSAGDGLLLENAAIPTLAGNTYEGNADYPINVDHVHSVAAVDDTSSFDASNGDNRVRYAGGTIGIDTDIADPGIPYLVKGVITVDNNATMTVAPGVALQFDTNHYLRIGNVNYGRLDAQGTEADPIVFTSAQPLLPPAPRGRRAAPGDWRGIFFADNAFDDSVLSNAVVEYAGTDVTWPNIRIYNSSPTIHGCMIRHSGTYGIRVENTLSAPEIHCNTIMNNVEGVRVETNAEPVLHDNDIFDNTSWGVQVSGTTEILAENNYWGAADGPGGVGAGSGDAVSAYVDYSPFLTGKAPCAWPCIDYYYDGDVDEYGTDDHLCLYEGPEAPYAALVSGDCDDADAAINPGAVEDCEDGIDDDCDDLVDYDDPDCDCWDGDEDGYDAEACGGDDCDDANAAVNPGADEDCDNAIDDDCDDLVDDADPDCDCWDMDGDFYEDDACGGDDCDDTNPAVNPGAVEGPEGDPTCGDGIDNDCDGLTDSDPECGGGCFLGTIL